jgi:hypothetical protein
MSLSIEKARMHTSIATIIQLIQNSLFSRENLGLEGGNSHANSDVYSVKI